MHGMDFNLDCYSGASSEFESDDDELIENPLVYVNTKAIKMYKLQISNNHRRIKLRRKEIKLIQKIQRIKMEMEINKLKGIKDEDDDMDADDADVEDADAEDVGGASVVGGKSDKGEVPSVGSDASGEN
jgi:hypothetical protein